MVSGRLPFPITVPFSPVIDLMCCDLLQNNPFQRGSVTRFKSRASHEVSHRANVFLKHSLGRSFRLADAQLTPLAGICFAVLTLII